MGKHKRKGTCPYPYFIAEDEKTVYVQIQSHITAMGFPAIMREYFPGYIGKIASPEYLETLREVHEKKKRSSFTDRMNDFQFEVIKPDDK